MVYRLKDDDLAVAEIRDRLRRIGLLVDSDVPDTYFDAAVAHAVREFQQQRGLVVDGVVGPDTFARLEEARWSLGDRVLTYAPGRLTCGDDVVELQRQLSRLGFDLGRVDGRFGPRTDGAIREFQRGVGLAPDGVCGLHTTRALARLARPVSGDTAPARLRELSTLDQLTTGVADKVIVLDVGPPTGGVESHDVGMRVARDIVDRVEGRLGALGVAVTLSQRPGGAAAPDDRASLANSVGADLVVSVYVGTATSHRANGLASFYFGDPLVATGSVLGLRAAELVHSHVTARTDLTDCRVHAKTWELLRLTKMPTVHVEAGYATSMRDARRLADPAFRDAVADGISTGIVDFFAPNAESP